MTEVAGVVINEKRFWDNVEVSGFCWYWTGYLRSDGYGGYGVLSAYRVAYELLVGEVPDGLELDHVCRNHACINPDHLEPVTHQENMLRYAHHHHNSRKTHCKQGHAFTPDNTRVFQGKRQCKRCNAAAAKRYAAKRRGGKK